MTTVNFGQTGTETFSANGAKNLKYLQTSNDLTRLKVISADLSEGRTLQVRAVGKGYISRVDTALDNHIGVAPTPGPYGGFNYFSSGDEA